MQDAKPGFDYMAFYTTHAWALGARVNIGDGVTVDASFLCLCGSLLNLSKYVVSFRGKLDEVQDIKGFKELALNDFMSAKGKKAPTSVYKLPCLLQMSSHFSKFAAACALFISTTQETHADEKEKIYFQKLMDSMCSCIMTVLVVCNQELDAGWAFLHESFQPVIKNHGYPSMFQGDKLDKGKIGALVGDGASQFLLFLGPLCSSLCHDVKGILEGVRGLKKEVEIPSNILTMLSSLESDFVKFGDTSHQGLPKEGGDGKIVLANFTYFQASLTLAQCLSRDLNPGETRLGLAKRCLDILVSKNMKFEPNLQRLVEALMAGK